MVEIRKAFGLEGLEVFLASDKGGVCEFAAFEIVLGSLEIVAPAGVVA